MFTYDATGSLILRKICSFTGDTSGLLYKKTLLRDMGISVNSPYK